MRVIAVTGGKGGVGKSTISINIAVELAKTKRVLLFDADLGLANVDVLLGLKAKWTIGDYLQGKCAFDDVCIQGPHGLKIIPSDSGVQHMSELSQAESTQLIRSFSRLSESADYMLVDLASGISNQVIDFTHASQNILIVVCNDPASLMDSYAVIKILYQKYGRNKFGVVVNKVKHESEGHAVFSRFQEAIAKFINITINYMGFIPDDEYISLASRSQVAVVDKYPLSNAARAFSELCRNIPHWDNDVNVTGGIQFFLENILQTDNIASEQLCVE